MGSNETAAKGEDLAALVGKSKPHPMTQEQYNLIKKSIRRYANEAAITEVKLAYLHALSLVREVIEENETFNTKE